MTEAERRAAAAARQQRYRDRQKAHEGGVHDDCNPRSCAALRSAAGDVGSAGDGAESVTRDVTDPPKNSVSRPAPPADLGARGARLWEEMAGLRLGPAHVLLLERACRAADRLGRLDVLLEGGAWLDLAEARAQQDGVVEVRVTVDRVLGETRQHEVALKLLVAELRHAGRPVAPPGAAPGPVSEAQESDDDDEDSGRPAGTVTNIAGILNRPAQGG